MKRTKQSTFAKRERQEKATGFAPVGSEDMSKSEGVQFTPGPWSAYNSKNGVIYKHWRVNTGTGLILLDDAAHWEAGNAHLIAAAPAMYTLLQDATLQLARLTGSNLETYARTFSVPAKTALAQAEGRQG